jgi:hypothetical protein
MSLQMIYVCDNCKKRSDQELKIRITTRDGLNEQQVRSDWKIFIGGMSRSPKRSATFGQDAHLCSAACLLGWLDLSLEASPSTSEGKL